MYYKRKSYEDMKKEGFQRVNVDLPVDLWKEVSVKSAVLGEKRKEFVITAITERLERTHFEHEVERYNGDTKRRNVDLPVDLWKEVSVESAKRDESKRDFVQKALEERLANMPNS